MDLATIKQRLREIDPALSDAPWVLFAAFERNTAAGRANVIVHGSGFHTAHHPRRPARHLLHRTAGRGEAELLEPGGHLDGLDDVEVVTVPSATLAKSVVPGVSSVVEVLVHEHEAPAGAQDPVDFTKGPVEVGPVVHGVDRPQRVNAAVGEGDGLCGTVDHRDARTGALGEAAQAEDPPHI
jgi:hypothetical protein